MIDLLLDQVDVQTHVEDDVTDVHVETPVGAVVVSVYGDHDERLASGLRALADKLEGDA